MTTTKDHRLALRLSGEQDALIRRAAEAVGANLTEFGVHALISRAHDVLADQRLFLLDDAAWAEFLAVLDAPVRHRPRLQNLFDEHTMFVEPA